MNHDLPSFPEQCRLALEAIEADPLNLPTSVVITGIDSMEVLDQACRAAQTFQKLGVEELKSLLARTAQAAQGGEFEPFKTTSIFDGTAKHPEWLGQEPERVQQLMPQ